MVEGEPFELIESIVTEESTGMLLTHEKVERGTTRLETLHFVANAPLDNLRRRTVTSMNLGFMWQPVSDETLEMGSHMPGKADDGGKLVKQFTKMVDSILLYSKVIKNIVVMFIFF